MNTHNDATPGTAIVTGGASGIGRAFVAALHRKGWTVVTCGRNADKLGELAKAFPGVHAYPCDVGDKQSVASFVDRVLAEHRAIKLLVNNAGALRDLDFNQPGLLQRDLTQELRSNLEGAIHMTAGFLPALRAGAPSSLVMVTSGFGLVPATRAPVYSASKAGLRSFTKALRRQLEGQGITVTDVAPPSVDTPATAHYQAKKISPEQVAEMTLAAAWSGREEVYPGAARWLPLMMRLAPGLIGKIVAKS